MNPNSKLSLALKHSTNQKLQGLDAFSIQGGSLNFRSLELTLTDLILIVPFFKEQASSSIKSVSFSYNKNIGDEGAMLIAQHLPNSLTELGMVNCGIGDLGGKALLNWMNKTSKLQMVCIEENNFSKELKNEFNQFKMQHPRVMLVI